MAETEPSGLTTIEAGTDDAHEDYNDNITRLNVQQVRYVRAQVGEAAGLSTHDAAYILPADGKLYKAQAASDLSKMPCVGIIEETKAQDQWAKAIFLGIVVDAAWSLTPGDVLVLSRDTEGEWNYLASEAARDYSPFSVQQVLGFVLTETSIFMCVNRPASINAGVMRDLAFDESTQAAVGYGTRGLLRVEDVDGTLELVYYDNGGAKTIITSGGLLNTIMEMKHHGDYGWSEVKRLEFMCGELEAKMGEPGTYEYTPPLAGIGTLIGSVAYYDGTSWIELVPGVEGEALTTHAAGVPPTWEPAGGIGAGTGIGDLLYWNGADWVPIAAGAEGEALTAHGAAIPTWEAASGGDPEVYTKRVIQAIAGYGGTTVYQVGQGAHSNTGTVTTADDADGCWHNFATTNVANNQASVTGSGSSSTRRDHEETLIVRFKTAASIAVMRLWGAGWTTNWITAGGADTPNLHIAGFRYSTNAGDANWMAVTGGAGGLGCTVTDTGIAVAINTVYTFRIVFNTAAADVKFYINDALVATHTTKLPDATTGMNYGVSVTTLETVIKSFKWSRIARRGK